MMPVPTRRLVRLAIALIAVSVIVVVVPSAAIGILLLDLVLFFTALLDLLATPNAPLLDLSRTSPERLSVLHDHDVEVRVRNHSVQTLAVRLRDTPPTGFDHDDRELHGVVHPGGELAWRYRVTPKRRGLHAWGAMHLRWSSRLGLWEKRKTTSFPAQVRVYPQVLDIHRHHLLARHNPLEAIGVRRVRQRGGAWEFESLRDYVSGDDVRQLDWKATARRGKLIVRNRQAERNQTLLVLLDCGRLMNAEENGVAKLDHALQAALLLSHVALSRGDRVGLCTFSHKVHAWVAPGGHVSQNRTISETLYDLRGDFTESDHGRCLSFVRSRHPKRSLLVVLTDFVDATTASEMLTHLQTATRRHLVLFVALKDAFLERAARSLPAEPREAYRKSAAVGLLHERREVLERIRQMGGHVIDAQPDEIGPPMLNQYLEITFRGLL